ncbi:MAG: cytochrome P450, partial [Myxococcota bacterium]
MRLNPVEAEVDPAPARPVRPTAPGPRELPFLGSLIPLVRDPLGFMSELHRVHGPYARFSVGPDRYLAVAHPDALRHVFVDHADRYVKGAGFDGIRQVLRSGLLTSDGERWLTRRKLAQPSFAPDRLAASIPAIDAAIAAAHDQWEAAAEIDLYEALVALTVDVVGRTLFAAPLADRVPAMRQATTDAMAFAWSYANEPVRLPLWLPTPGRLRFRRAMATLDALAGELADGPSELLRALAVEGPDAVRDELLTMLLAGHETTAATLTFAFAAVLPRRDLVERLAADGDALPAAPTPGEIHRMTTSAAVFYETLRLWPAVWFIERRAVAADEVAGHPVPAGGQVGVSPWAIHRDPARWPDPERFDPDRFG